MLQTSLLATGHADLVTHVVYNFYGDRLATCSADQKIKVYRKSSEDGTWEVETEWKAHDAAVLHLSFAHPIHGSLLASSSYDRTVRIWEEHPSSLATAPGTSRWAEKGTLTGAKGGVRVVEFAPPNPAFGLRVASISSDSHMRVYTSLDPDLSDWSLVHDIHVPSLLAPGSLEDPASTLSAPLEPPTPAEAATGGWGLSWCKEKWWGSVVVAFAGNSAVAKVVSLDPTPTSVVCLKPGASTSSPLTCIAWAPSCGRSYHLIATGSRDGVVRIWRVEPPSEDGPRTWTAENIVEFGKGPRIGMVEWNATGTTLTTSDDEGQIKIYKPTYAKNWKLLGKMTAEEPPATDDD